jgi:hypothetical protein
MSRYANASITIYHTPCTVHYLVGDNAAEQSRREEHASQ